MYFENYIDTPMQIPSGVHEECEWNISTIYDRSCRDRCKGESRDSYQQAQKPTISFRFQTTSHSTKPLRSHWDLSQEQ